MDAAMDGAEARRKLSNINVKFYNWEDTVSSRMIAPRCYLSVQASLGPGGYTPLGREGARAVISQRTKAALAAAKAHG